MGREYARDERGGERSVRGVHSMRTQFAGLEVNVRTGISTTREYAWSVRVCGLVLTSCVRHTVTHAKTRNDHTHTREGI